MKILVVGGTGTVGTEVVRALLDRGAAVRITSRNVGPATRSGVETVQADLEAPQTLSKAFDEVDGVFLVNALSQSETAQGIAAVEAARKGGAKKLVYMSVVMPPGSETIPHFASKIPVEQSVRASGLEWTILKPNEFYQNDIRLKDPIVNYGVYPVPIGNKGVSRVDVRDIADGAVNAFFDSAHIGKTYPLHGPEPWTGEATARVYAEHLGREVNYGGDDLGAWSQRVSAFMPDWLVRDLKAMYAFFQENGVQPTAEDKKLQHRLLGHDPRGYETFVWEVSRGWKNLSVER